MLWTPGRRASSFNQSSSLLMRLRLVLSLFLLLGLAAPLFGREAREQRRIDHLLHVVGSLGTAKFIRNGTEYDAKTAETHLRQKLDYAGEKLKTAEQFIEYCGARSSMSGKSYQIRFPDDKAMEAGPFLRAKLAEFDKTEK
jgi:hypothetical protein